jgi:hypothetical protein
MNYIEKPYANFNSEVKTHKDYTDVSFYETYSKIKKVELDALIPVPNDDPDHGVVTTPDRLYGYFGLYNSSLDKLLETRPVSSTYKLVPHHELFHEQAKILGQSDLPLENITVKDQLYKGGLQAHRTIFFHDLETTVSNNKDKVLSRIDIFNSCDMSWSFQVFSGAYRDLCRNTLVFGGQKAYHQQAKHTRNLSTTALMTKASIGLEFWNNQKDTMLNWRAKDMSLEQFGQILKQTICKKKSKSAELNLTNPVNETKLNYLLDRFEKETPDLGKTMWAGYNALTHWATHTDETIEKEIDNKLVKIRSGKSTADKPSVQRTRNDEVRTVIECDAWKELEIA